MNNSEHIKIEDIYNCALESLNEFQQVRDKVNADVLLTCDLEYLRDIKVNLERYFDDDRHDDHTSGREYHKA